MSTDLKILVGLLEKDTTPGTFLFVVAFHLLHAPIINQAHRFRACVKDHESIEMGSEKQFDALFFKVTSRNLATDTSKSSGTDCLLKRHAMCLPISESDHGACFDAVTTAPHVHVHVSSSKKSKTPNGVGASTVHGHP